MPNKVRRLEMAQQKPQRTRDAKHRAIDETLNPKKSPQDNTRYIRTLKKFAF